MGDDVEDADQRIQEDEKMALESIFGEDAIFPKNVWEVWRPLEVTIHLEPLHTGEEESRTYVSADLHVKCSENYPKSAPTLGVIQSKGLSKMQITDLLTVLNTRCRELVGNPMILELCDEVRKFLFDRNRPPLGSFHDVMLRYKENQDFLMKKERATSEAREKKAILEERERQQLEAELRSEARQTENANGDNVWSDDTRLICGRIIYVSPKIATRPRHPMCEEWYGYFQKELLLISEYTFRCATPERAPKSTTDSKYRILLEKLDEIETMGKSLCASSALEETLVPYRFVGVDKISLSSASFIAKIYVAQKLSDEEECFSNCAKIVRKEDFLRRLTASAVCALRYLHDQKLCHGFIVPHSLWCTKSSLRFTDYCLKRPLLSLCEYFKYYTGETENYNVSEEKIRRDRDLKDLAFLLKEISSNNAFIENEENIEELDSFITTCQNAKNVEELIYHPLFNNSAIVFESDESFDSGRGVTQQRDTRLAKEFIVQRSIGKGAFGTVLQVRNKVDWNDYAVKCIRIDPLDDELLTKITREAKLVSKLNHPNVVRYYNSWIGEVAIVRRHLSPKGRSPASEEVLLKEYTVDEDSLLPSRLRNVEVAAEGLKIDASEWTASCRGVKTPSSSDDSSEDESDEQQAFGSYSNANSNSLSILFERPSSPETSTPSKGQDVKPDREFSPENEKSLSAILSGPSMRSPVAPVRTLYIQMEYCGGGTLRRSIDSGQLYVDPRMIWKLFAEILSGLDYIHRQGMIHRDIKPMNILLDIEGHVKIGDFGLATKDLLLRKTRSVGGVTTSASLENALTKDIGTETYMAPELFDVNNVEPYTSKIDVYSTGIVFFEMCSKPLFGMERQATLTELKAYAKFPGDFGQGFSNVQAKHVRHLIKWMLQAQAEKRPTVEELMRDNLIPLVEDEDKQFKKIFSQALKNRSRTYYWMLDTITKEEQPAARTFCFDQDICKDKFASSRDEYIDRLRNDLSELLKLYAFLPLSTHLLVPKSKNALESCSLMRSKPSIMVDDHGNVVMLPIDLRQNFLRYCARNAINRMKRYTFDRVYANKDASEGVHPTETYECCVDSVGAASGASTLTADLLSVVMAISSRILWEYKCTLRIGHMSLIEAAMMQAGVAMEKKWVILQSMQEGELIHSHTHVAKIIEGVSKHVDETTVRRFIALLPRESSLSTFKEKCKSMLRSRDLKVKEASRSAISDLEKITELLIHASSSDNLEIIFDGATVYRPSTFGEGIVFRLTCALPNPKRGGTIDVIFLAGGRYDSLLRNELHPQDIRPAHPSCLVGFSISLNVLAEIKRKFSNEKNCTCDALVCSYSQPLLKEKFELVKMLRSSGISTDIMHEPISTVPEILEHCIKSNIANLMIVFNDDEVLVLNSTIDHGKMTFAAALDCIDKKNEDFLPKTQQPSVPSAPATFANCAIVYAMGERPAPNTKRKIENQIRVGLANTFAQFSSSEKILVLVTSLPVDIVKSVSYSMNKGMMLDEVNRVFDTLGKSCGKAKEDMEFLYEHMKKIFALDRKARPAVIIYRQQDSFWQVMS